MYAVNLLCSSDKTTASFLKRDICRTPSKESETSSSPSCESVLLVTLNPRCAPFLIAQHFWGRRIRERCAKEQLILAVARHVRGTVRNPGPEENARHVRSSIIKARSPKPLCHLQKHEGRVPSNRCECSTGTLHAHPILEYSLIPTKIRARMISEFLVLIMP